MSSYYTIRKRSKQTVFKNHTTQRNPTHTEVKAAGLIKLFHRHFLKLLLRNHVNMLTYAVILTVLFGCTLSRDIRSETTCQTHQRNAGGASALMHWDIQCDAEGNYLPLQCTRESPKWCACYSKDDVLSRPSTRIKSCECHLAKDAAQKAKKGPCEISECDTNGKFLKKQCCQQKCRCVDPTTGQTTRQPVADLNLQCP
ncbi:uncharacterized protein TNCT_376611 [Trichonephila clavata]|uniref:Thyroglobulin type-1 domain-containing protein n=1 Tax=Trichonephila clavata TaxID=2740835 RepID=A0A8X6JB46_TRICU|nr:uncharacterized protein TNCT_376611 [Trichonephila clavata]